MQNNTFMQKIALVTGATSGIGRATTLAFARAGARVAFVGRNEEALTKVDSQLKSLGVEGLPIQAELSDENGQIKAISKALAHFGGIDILVNSAGHINSGTIETTSIAAWDEMLNV